MALCSRIMHGWVAQRDIQEDGLGAVRPIRGHVGAGLFVVAGVRGLVGCRDVLLLQASRAPRAELLRHSRAYGVMEADAMRPNAAAARMVAEL
eukprot:8505822-Lingulodinium_polyedra.AAC.1